MKLLSINVGLPREVLWKGKKVTTGIFKEPVEGAVMLRQLNLEGDRQADLTVHGGEDKAVYVYPSEHYTYWREKLPDIDFTWGNFGENFTVEGMKEDYICIGDQFCIGNAIVMVTQPRLPCYKLGIRFNRPDMVKLFLSSRRTGFYLSVVKEGMVNRGDKITDLHRSTHGVTVSDITRLYAFDRDATESMERILEVEALPESWREYFAEQVRKLR